MQLLNTLEELLADAAATPERGPAFVSALMQATLFAITHGLPPNEVDHRVNLLTLRLDDGTAAVPLFTATERIAEVYGAGTPFFGLAGRAMLGMLAEQTVVINPGLATGAVYDSDHIKRLLGQVEPTRLPAGTQMMLGEPEETPTALVDRLTRALEGDSSVTAAWLALAHWPAAGEWSWLVDVRSDAPPKEIVALVVRALEGADTGGRPVDTKVGLPGDPAGHGIQLLP